MSARDEIMKQAAVPTAEDTILGQKVMLRGLTCGQQTSIFDGRPIRELLVPVCAAGILDEKGEPMFTEAELRGLKAAPFGKAFAKILELTGHGSEEDEEKNS